MVCIYIYCWLRSLKQMFPYSWFNLKIGSHISKNNQEYFLSNTWQFLELIKIKLWLWFFSQTDKLKDKQVWGWNIFTECMITLTHSNESIFDTQSFTDSIQWQLDLNDCITFHFGSSLEPWNENKTESLFPFNHCYQTFTHTHTKKTSHELTYSIMLLLSHFLLLSFQCSPSWRRDAGRYRLDKAVR